GASWCSPKPVGTRTSRARAAHLASGTVARDLGPATVVSGGTLSSTDRNIKDIRVCNCHIGHSGGSGRAHPDMTKAAFPSLRRRPATCVKLVGTTGFEPATP